MNTKGIEIVVAFALLSSLVPIGAAQPACDVTFAYRDGTGGLVAGAEYEWTETANIEVTALNPSTPPCGSWDGKIVVEVDRPDGSDAVETVVDPRPGTTATYLFGTEADPAVSPLGTYATRATLSGTSVSRTSSFTLVCGVDLATVDATSIGHNTGTLNLALSDLGPYSPVGVFFKWGTSAEALTTTTSTIQRTTAGPVSATLAGLASSTTYHFRAFSAPAQCGAQGITKSFTTSATQPVVVTTAEATDIASTTATLRGTLTNLGTATSADVSFVYGLTAAALSQTTTPQTRTTTGAFQASLTGLSTETTYFFRAVSDPAGSAASTLSFTTADVTAPSAPGTISSTSFPATGYASSRTGTLTWGAATDTRGIKGYKTTVDGVAQEAAGQLTTGTSKTITVGSDGAHSFGVVAVDNSDLEGPSASYTFNVDGTPPTAAQLASTTHQEGTVCNSGASATFTWSGASDAGSGLASTPYSYRLDAAAPVSTSATTATLSGLADGSHSLVLTTSDVAGLTGTDTYAFKVDLAAPTVTLSGPTAARAAFQVSWAGVDSCSTVAGYTIESRKGSEPFASFSTGTPTTKSLTPSGGDGAYQFRGKAADALGHEGAFPDTPQLTVIFDTTAPSAATGLTATPSSAGAIDLSWTAGADTGSGMAGYHVYRATSATGTFTKITSAPSSGTGYRDAGTNTVSGTTYHYMVAGVDNAGNEGAQSAAASATSDHSSNVQVGTQQTVTQLGAIGITLTRVPQANDTDGDGHLDQITPNIGASLYDVFPIDGADALLLSAAPGALPLAIWVPATNTVLPIASQTGLVTGTETRTDGTLVTVTVTKADNWILVRLANPQPGRSILRIEKPTGEAIPMSFVLDSGSELVFVDDASFAYVVVYAPAAAQGQNLTTTPKSGTPGFEAALVVPGLLLGLAAAAFARRHRRA